MVKNKDKEIRCQFIESNNISGKKKEKEKNLAK